MGGLREYHGPGLLLVGLCLVVLPSVVEGSHFRYGTISWRPVNYQENIVEFSFEVAYRRNFEWGKFFREQWAAGPTDNPQWVDGGSCFTQSSCLYRDTEPQPPHDYYQFFDDPATDYTFNGLGGWYIKLAVGRSYYLIDGDDEFNVNGKLCNSPYDTGDFPTCGPDDIAGVTLKPNYNMDSECAALSEPDRASGKILSEWRKDFVEFENSPCDLYIPYDGSIPYDNSAVDEVPCEEDDNVDPDYCSPWSQTYGFFFGDGEYTDIVLTIKEVEREMTVDGNYILATSEFQHQYSSNKKATIRPWKAFFTGGNRISLTENGLQNNGQGRFRVEITVNIQEYNHSPIATSFPVLPVPYAGRGEISAYGMMASFRISAYDPDIDPEAYDETSLKTVHNQDPYFFIGNRQQHGYLLSNQVPDLKYPSKWYESAYEEARMKCYNISCVDPNTGVAPAYPSGCGFCPEGGSQPICSTTTYTNDNNTEVTLELEFSCDAYPVWNNAQHLAHAPPRMVMDPTTGVVLWEVGINPYENDTMPYLYDWDRDGDNVIEPLGGTTPDLQPVRPGFYNLVVDIRSESGDPDCIEWYREDQCINSPGCMENDIRGDCALEAPDAPQIAYVSVPLDFLLYLYPPAFWCSKANPTCANDKPGITTFRDHGFYGHAFVEGEGDALPKLELEDGTLVKRVVEWKYDAPGTGVCTICGGGENTKEELYNYTVCTTDDWCGQPYNDTISEVPVGLYCKQNTLPVWIDEDLHPGATPVNTAARGAHDTATEAPIVNDLAVFYGKRAKEITFNLVAHDFDDCVELSIWTSGIFKGANFFYLDSNGMPTNQTVCEWEESSKPQGHSEKCPWDMILENATRIGEQVDLGPNDGRTIRRIFRWPVGLKEITDPATGETEMVEYEQWEDPRPPNVIVCFFPFDRYMVGVFRCINIILTVDKELYWRDQRPDLLTMTGFTGTTPAHETTFYVAPHNLFELVMTAKQDTGYQPLGIHMTEGQVPRGATWEYNNTDVMLRDPATRTLSWIPEEGQQCEYRFCFMANNTRQDPALISYAVRFDILLSRDERCYTLIVLDQTLDFDGGTYVDAPASLPLLTAECGMSVGLWFLPEGTITMPLLTMGYTLAGETQKNVVHQLSWDPVTAAVFNDGVTSQDLKQFYRLVYTHGDGNANTTIMTDADFCVTEWHFAMFTLAPDGALTLYLDGIEATHFAPDTRDFHVVEVETGTMPTSADGKVKIIGSILGSKPGATPFFHLGAYGASPYDGKITDVRVYSRALSMKEVGEKMFKVLIPEEEIGLEAYYKFNEGSQKTRCSTCGHVVADGSYNKYRMITASYPSDGECPVDGDTDCDGVADSPTEPYPNEMDAKTLYSTGGYVLLDYSGNNFHAMSCDPATDAQCASGNLHHEFLAAPTSATCPKEFDVDVVHVDGGEMITVTGVSFARSVWLKCSFSMSYGKGPKVVRAEYINENTVVCQNPGSPDVTVSMLEITNGNYYSSQRIPMYIMERGVRFLSSGGAIVVDGICHTDDSTQAQLFDDTSEFSIGGWVYPQSVNNAPQSGAVFTLTGSDAGTLEVSYDGSMFVLAEIPSGGTKSELGRSGEAPAQGRGEGAGWHYVMLTADEEYNMTLYVDGDAFPMTTKAQVMFDGSCAFKVGAVGQGNALMSVVEEISVWSMHLEQCHATQLMWGNFTRRELCPEGDSITTAWNEGLVSYLKLNGPKSVSESNIAVDTSGNEMHGVLEPDAHFEFTTVPFLAPSFNRPRPRLGPPTSITTSGPNGKLVENYTLPRAFNDYYAYVVFHGEGDGRDRVFSEPPCMPPACPEYGTETTHAMLTVDGFEEATIVGYGFAESKWLQCEFNGEVVSATYKSEDEVSCPIAAVPQPGMYSLSVSNMYRWEEECEVEYRKREWPAVYEWPQMRLQNYAPELEMKESAMFFDGADDYIFSGNVSQMIGEEYAGVTFGAWFWPMDDSSDKEQPIMCFTSACKPPPPPPCPPAPSPPPVCLVYKDQRVYISSELASDTYNDLFYNMSASHPASVGEWHYAEVIVQGRETDPFIVSDGENVTGNIPTYIATMTVDTVPVTGEGGDIRIPLQVEHLASGGFFVGGIGCDDFENNPFYPMRHLLQEYSNESFHFHGLIDEVRVYRGAVRTDWFARLPEDGVTPVAHYRMSDDSGMSQDLYQYRRVGPFVADFSGNNFHAQAYEYGADAANTTYAITPDYVYVESPMEASRTDSVDMSDIMLQGEMQVTVTGYGVAKSQWLFCSFGTGEVSMAKEVSFGAYAVTNATYVDKNTVTCMTPPVAMPTLGYVQMANPKGAGRDMYTYRDTALVFGGDQMTEMEVVGGTANRGEVVDMECPAGMRMDKVLFASYGRPLNRCNAHEVTNCDLTKSIIPCDYMLYEINDKCHSDAGKPPYWSIDVLEKHCLGKASCSVPASDAVWGDPCPGEGKWLEVAMRCSDRFSSKDYITVPELLPEIAEGDFTFSTWIFPHDKKGVQSVLSIGGAPGQDMLNRHLLQWEGDDGMNTGRFYYYDDCIQDVLMKYADGRDIIVATQQWYYLTFTMSASGTGQLMLNGIPAASWTTSCRPDLAGSFIIGMDLDDESMPKEFFAGLLDETVIYSYAISSAQAAKSMCWTEPDTLGLLAHYQYNMDMGSLTKSETGKLHGHLAATTDTRWDLENATFTPGDVVHPQMVFMGVPWFPTYTFAAEVTPGASLTGPLMGSTEVTLKGLNFATRTARAFYMGEEIPYAEVDDQTMTAVIPNLKEPQECTEGGTFALHVVNALDPTDSEVCHVGAGTVTEDVSYSQQLDMKDLSDGLICYFPLNGDANDYSGDARHGTSHGAMLTTNRNGYPNQAYAFGKEDSIDISECINGLTVAMWIYYDDLPMADIFYKNVPLEAYEPETGCQVSTNASLNNAWLHVVGVVDDDMVTTLYVNGEPSDNTKYFEQILSILSGKDIGGDGFHGAMDEVWIWDRELCASEITALYTTQEFALEFGYGNEVEVPLATPAQGSLGLLAAFFGAGREHYEVMTVLDQEWEMAAPQSGYSTDEWSLELTGYIYAPYSQEYNFYIAGDDSFRLWINRGEPTIGDTPAWGSIATSFASGEGTNWVYSPEVDGVKGPIPEESWVNVINSPCRAAYCGYREVMGNIELNEGWYEIYMSYTDKKDDAAVSLKWQTTDGDIPKQLIPKEYLRSGAGPFTVEAWVWPYQVDGRHTVVGRDVHGFNGLGLGIEDGGLSASIYTGCKCQKAVPGSLLNDTAAAETLAVKCNEYRELTSWKSKVVAGAWQHIQASYTGTQWMLYVDGLLTDVTTYPDSIFMPETTSPFRLGRENLEQKVTGSPNEVRQYFGLLHSMAFWTVGDHVPSIICPSSGPEASLVLYLKMDEGAGLKLYDFSGKDPWDQMFMHGMIVPARAPLPLWVNGTCGTWGTHLANTQIAGTALHSAVAGKCAVFTLTSYDRCGHKRLSGGDNYTVHVVGPLHLHTEVVEYHMGMGIVDNNAGAYSVTFNRTIAGYYLIKVYLDGVEAPHLEAKTYIHPYISDPSMTYLFNADGDRSYLDELEFNMAGVPVTFNLQTVDTYGNLRTVGGIEDMSLTFEGPYTVNSTWMDNMDGTYTFMYTVHVPGPYKMLVRMYGNPICRYGGKTCLAGSQGAYDSCTLANVFDPPEYIAPCTFCINVMDGSSLSTSEASVYASFPDSDALDLVASFTAYAFFRKMDALPSSMEKEYILSKQSEFSGKGYWLALVPNAALDGFDLEGGVYVGAENFRVVRGALPTVTEWVHVTMQYTGLELMIHVDAEELDRKAFLDEAPKFARPNQQPLRVGKGFNGLIDNVVLMEGIRPLEQFVPDSFCPLGMNPMTGPVPQPGLLGYYRFNENSGWATKDSSAMGNDGVVGLVCDIAPEGKTARLSCPENYTISEILYANFGDNDGGCGHYEAGECMAENSMEVVSNQCLGMQSCAVRSNKDQFSPGCKSSTKSLAINAVCTGSFRSWSAETAPSLVGVTTVDPEKDFICPFDYLDSGLYPDWLVEDLREVEMMGAQCSISDANVDIMTAEAGRMMVWGLHARDGCGYKSLHGRNKFAGDMGYPAFFDLSMDHTCPELPMSRTHSERIDFAAGSTNGTYCGHYNDVYVMFYNMTTTGKTEFALFMDNEPLMEAGGLTVVPAAISPLATTATGAGLVTGEAGIEQMFVVTARDFLGNLRAQFGDEGELAVTTDGPADTRINMLLGQVPGEYNFYITYPVAGEYKVMVTVGGASISETTANVDPMQVRPITALNQQYPAGRYEFSAVPYQENVYFFGGSTAGKVYLDEMIKFDTKYDAKKLPANSHLGGFKYRRLVQVTNMPMTEYNIELSLNTKEMIEMGRLKPDCSDMRFLEKETGRALPMWVEPHSAPAGCGLKNTTVWIKVPGGMEEFYMYYCNKAAMSVSNPHTVFSVFEDFEMDGELLGGDNGWMLDGASGEECISNGYHANASFGDSSSFYTSDVTAVHGKRSLKMDTVHAGGGTIIKDIPTMNKFTMKAYIYDSMCSGSHWISPDFESCSDLGNSKSLLPHFTTGMGIYTGAASDVYSVTYPWHSSPAERSIGWHSFTFRDDDTRLRLMVDEEIDLPLRSENISTDINKLFLLSQLLPDQMVGSSVYWDAILVSEYDPEVYAESLEEEPVTLDQDYDWSVVETSAPPPKRQSHSAVVYGDAMYVFGGERSAYEYSDLWKFTFLTAAWEFQATYNSSAMLPRHDHSAVVYEDKMYVYGGRSPMPRGDMWVYSFTNMTWTKAEVVEGMAPRFGHTAAVSGGVMYVYGGYASEEKGKGMLTEEVWAYTFATAVWTSVGPRHDNFKNSWTESATNAMWHPQPVPPPRFAHASVMTGSKPALYVIGGAGGPFMMEEFPELWKFDLERLQWFYMGSDPLLGRYDSSAVLFGEDKFALVYGGHAEGKFLDDAFIIFLGETGL
ncbi:hypothetical protein CYMTET_4743 [Cymbomonas tetramitiformis]|uniref:LamG-like jellyroll fold domain-containing protein n=1 Tax=Cymbomonas tetramitiformis TaxID=36881 RepID=A0AAE0LJL1_9CHLO|nr:hypothetical protein CYMTET_4743 [Cymbomonas tetramitiformis]